MKLKILIPIFLVLTLLFSVSVSADTIVDSVTGVGSWADTSLAFDGDINTYSYAGNTNLQVWSSTLGITFGSQYVKSVYVNGGIADNCNFGTSMIAKLQYYNGASWVDHTTLVNTATGCTSEDVFNTNISIGNVISGLRVHYSGSSSNFWNSSLNELSYVGSFNLNASNILNESILPFTVAISGYVFPNSSMEASYYFDDWSVNDSSGSNDGVLNGYTLNDGTLSGGVVTGVTGADDMGLGVSFDSVITNFIRTPLINDSEIISLSVWVKPLDTCYGNICGVINNLNGQNGLGRILIFSTDLLRLQMRFDGVDTSLNTATGVINRNEWNHIGLVLENNSQKIYINGVANSFTTAGIPDSGVVATIIGQAQINNFVFNGSMDEFRQWKGVALSENEMIAESNSHYPVVTDGLVTSYSFESYNATHVSDTNWNVLHNNTIDNSLEGAISFDGVGEYVDSDSNIGLTGNQPLTISFDFKTQQSGANKYIFNMADVTTTHQGILAILHNNRIKYGHWGSTQVTSKTINDGQWHNFVMTYNGSRVNDYLDGSLDSGYDYNSLNLVDGTLRLGEYKGGGAFYYSGSIDNVKIFDRALSSQEVGSLYNSNVLSYSTTNGTVNTGLIVDDNTNVDLDFSTLSDANGLYFNQSFPNINASTPYTATGFYQAIVDLWANELITSNVLSSFHVQDEQTNTNYLATDGIGTYKRLNVLAGNNKNFTFNNLSNYYNQTSSFNFTALETYNDYYLLDQFDYKLNFTAKINLTSAAINNFTLNLSNLANSYAETKTTTNGSTSFNMLQSLSYNSTIDSSLYMLDSFTHTGLTGISSVYNYYLWETNSVYISIYDEENDTILTGVNISVEIFNDDDSKVDTTTNGTVLFSDLTPGDYLIRYSATNYSERSYFVTITDRETSSINLYLLRDSEAEEITVYVFDTTGDPVENALVKMLKFYIDCNCYQTVQVEQTDFEGSAANFLVDGFNSELYKFIISFGGTDYLETNPFKITSATLNFFIDFSDLDVTSSLGVVNGIASNLSFSNVTADFTFTYSDSGSNVVSACLKVYRELPSSSTLTNSTCISSTAGTITVTAPRINGTTYKAVANVVFDGEDYVIDTLYQTYSSGGRITGLVGVFLTMILVLGFALISLWNPSVSIVLTVTAIVLAGVLGILTIGKTALMGLIAVGVIIILRNKS